MAHETTTLNNGTVVLARKDRYGYFGACTYMNDTQAMRKVATLDAQGVKAYVYVAPMSAVRYIVIY